MMVFSKAEEEPTEEPTEEPIGEQREDVPETEVSETRYMGEGPPGVNRKDQIETTETAYMGEPEERTEPKHGKEYKRRGKRMGRRVTLEEHRKPKEGGGEKKAG